MGGEGGGGGKVKVMVLCHLMVVIFHQKELHLIGVGEQAINTSHNGVGS